MDNSFNSYEYLNDDIRPYNPNGSNCLLSDSNFDPCLAFQSRCGHGRNGASDIDIYFRTRFY